ncbi:hypothetical protein C0Q70_01111 [Pomacea canaliculata]|uniref:Uncharacterized protein n=1 Tax=Pomacea canaliculata TaxID=400727 RepID=A0A2T7PYJ1_POMCA|nr:hypothetical protein C0Q70_01111 [Pomacea canaliculata]
MTSIVRPVFARSLTPVSPGFTAQVQAALPSLVCKHLTVDFTCEVSTGVKRAERVVSALCPPRGPHRFGVAHLFLHRAAVYRRAVTTQAIGFGAATSDGGRSGEVQGVTGVWTRPLQPIETCERFDRFSREWHHENKQCQITRRYSSSHNHPKGIHAQSRVEALAGWQITTGEKVPKALEKCVFQSELKGPGPKPVNFFNAHLG